MSTILFDASVHLGQLCITSERIRNGCKQSQSTLSEKSGTDYIGLWTDNENGRVDNAIWSIPREVQDVFYPFMDRFYSMKNIHQIIIDRSDAEEAIMLMDANLGLTYQSAFTCAVAARHKVNEIHTLYGDLLSAKCMGYMESRYGIIIKCPLNDAEETYPEDVLEQTYQDALATFSAHKMNIFDVIHDPRVATIAF